MLKLQAIVGIAVAASVCFGLILLWIWLHLHRRKAKSDKANSFGDAEFVRYDFATMKAATANFSASNKLGEGGFGVVYKGKLKSGKEIAVKRVSHNRKLETEVFMIETRVVARVRHTNLVKLLGLCSEGKEKLLVYEYLPNASLDCFLLDPSKRTLLNWQTRYKIVFGVAKGLEYLHEGSDIRMLHCGLKTSNILLDDEMDPKVADICMGKLFGVDRDFTNTCTDVGTHSAVATYAYIAPEYFHTGRYSVKSDVHSFGVIVLETVSGLQIGKHNHFGQRGALLVQASRLWDEDRLLELMDPALHSSYSESDVIRCLQIGILCVQIVAEHRPMMGEVVLMLTGKLAIPLPSGPVSL